MNSVSRPNLESSSRLDSVQLLRGVAALLVLFHHLSLRFEQRLFDSRLFRWFDDVGFAGVDLFFVLSGLIMMVTCHAQLGQRSAAGPFLWRRVTRIYPLYWLFTLAQLAALALLPSLSERALSLGHIVASFALWPQSVYPLLAPGWTLVYEMYFYGVFACLFFLPRRLIGWFLVGWGILSLLAYWQLGIDGRDTTDWLQVPLWASPLVLEFLLGCWIGYRYQQTKTLPGRRWVLGGGIVWFACGWWLVESATGWSAEFGLTRVLTFGVASAAVVYGLLEPSDGSGFRTALARLSVWLGNLSYSLYLSHLLVINALLFVCQRWLPESTSRGGQLAVCLAAAVVCVGFASVAYRWLERPLLVLCRKKQ